MEKRLLCIFSHPDDEAYGPAGTIHHVASSAGGRVRIVCATRGEAGTIGISKQYTPPDLARIRQAELFAAVRILESEVHVLGFPDRHVEEVDPGLAVELVVDEIRSFRPHVLLAFHPNGISGHPDHKAMTRHARTAFDAAGDPAFERTNGTPDREPWQPERLYYYSLTRTRAQAVEHFRTIQFVEDEEIDLALDVTAGVARKHAACLAHGTQTDFYRQLLTASGGIDRFWTVEHHIVGASSGRKPGKLAGLFDGIDTSRA